MTAYRIQVIRTATPWDRPKYEILLRIPMKDGHLGIIEQEYSFTRLGAWLWERRFVRRLRRKHARPGETIADYEVSI